MKPSIRATGPAAFLGRPGWKLEIASAQPLWPQGFDPLNVTLVARGEILHRRWVKLGNAVCPPGRRSVRRGTFW